MKVDTANEQWTRCLFEMFRREFNNGFLNLGWYLTTESENRKLRLGIPVCQ